MLYRSQDLYLIESSGRGDVRREQTSSDSEYNQGADNVVRPTNDVNT